MADEKPTVFDELAALGRVPQGSAEDTLRKLVNMHQPMSGLDPFFQENNRLPHTFTISDMRARSR